MLKRVEGDIIKMTENGDFDCIIHGCNCKNVMGAGLAKRLKDRWPGVYAADVEATKQWKKPIAKLGNFSTYVNLDATYPFMVINAYTQIDYGRGRDNFEYEAFHIILRKIESLDPNSLIKFGFPMIGMGLAGGDPDRIIPMIEDFATRHNTTLVEYKP